jgi:hypothetical protein
MKESTQYHGVKKKYKGWEANITVNGVTIYLGRYSEQKTAAKAYDLYVIRHGLKRKTNFFKKKLAINE